MTVKRFWEEIGVSAVVSAPVEELPEETSLQRAVKRRLLMGGKIGWAEGVLNGKTGL